ncbi:MAG: lytic transglycosylase domain-containing protein [Ferruginibacter sp.]
MKRIWYISSFIILFLLAGPRGYSQQEPVDTSGNDDPKEDALIEEVVKSKTPPEKEKVQYFSQVTRYGFRNLFAQYSYNPMLPYSSQVNPNAEAYMQDYLKAHRNYLIKMKGWGQPYFNLMDNILSMYGLPRELKYLAVIESNLNTGATSWVGAGGPWQFMPGTARDYGLLVNGYLDERRDYYKSTHAAARYLLTLYRQLHDWLLVIAAYNGGPGRVYNAIKKSGSRNFWALQYYLPEESRNHVKKFIATHYIMEGTGGITTAATGDMVSGGIDPNGGMDPFSNKPKLSDAEMQASALQTISGKYNSLVISKNLSMDINQFNRYNPQFDELIASNGNYDLRLPADKMQVFLANKYVILNECVQLLLGENSAPESQQTYYRSSTPVKARKKKTT